MGFIEHNCSLDVKAIAKGHVDVPYWTKAEFEQAIRGLSTKTHQYHMYMVMVWVYFMTGVRVNEGTALWWENVDFEKKQLDVHHMMQIKTRRDWTRNSYTKTKSGARIISLDDDTIDVLKIWRKRQEEIGLGGEKDFIFSVDGLPRTTNLIQKMMAMISRITGVKYIQAKGLRHSHASYLINEFNVSVLLLSKRLGHSSPDITLKHYSHMWAGADTVIADQISGNIEINFPEFNK